MKSNKLSIELKLIIEKRDNPKENRKKEIIKLNNKTEDKQQRGSTKSQVGLLKK